jgi:2-phospho-L-lactate transferase/gluconeogenesis factor (CofD/UPF0052 family)
MTAATVLSPEALDAFLADDPVGHVHTHRSQETYDLLSFGGGSCPKVVGQYAACLGAQKMCFLTNGSDNGGSTYKIVEALRAEYGPTLPVGDITSALIGLLEPFQYELLNLRAWNLDPERFSDEERHTFAAALQGRSSFYERLALAIQWYLDKFTDPHESDVSRERFCAELLELARLVDETRLIRSGVKGLDISEASVRHHIFNALMIRTGAYDANRNTPDAHRFMVGLSLLQRALSIHHAVFPCSLDEQVLYAEWMDNSEKLLWSTKHVSPDRPVTRIGGQVALSNAPDSAKRLDDGTYARYGRFGFDPELPTPRAYPEAIDAIGRVRPGAPILFGPSSFVVSISPCLAIREIAAAVAARSDCPRILFLNLTRNSETVGWCVNDFLDFWELNTARPVADTLDYIVVNNDLDSTAEVAQALTDKGDTPETFKFRGPVTVTQEERAAIPRRGITLVEAPLATVSRTLMRLSSTAERQFVWVPSHHSERLMAVCRLLVEDACGAAPASSGPSATQRKVALDAEGKMEAVIYDPPPA